MPQLNNKPIHGGFTLNHRWSFGPFGAVDKNTLLFDVRLQKFPRWLGYNASALFGLAQHAESWTGEFTERFAPVKQAYLDLLDRTRHRFCGQVNLIEMSAENSEVDAAAPLKPAGLLYQYICLSILEQFEDKHRSAAKAIETSFATLENDYGTTFSQTYVDGPNFEFGFECRQQEQADRLQVALVKAGILAHRLDRQLVLPNRFPNSSPLETSPGLNSNRFAFQLNLSFRESEMQLFWDRMRLALDHLAHQDIGFDAVQIERKADIDSTYEYHQRLMEAKVKDPTSPRFDARAYLVQDLGRYPSRLEAVLITARNYPQYREQILAMQTAVYEPARRSPPEEFDMLFDSDTPLSIIVLEGDQIVAMAFAGRLGLFTQERGVNEDPYRDDPSCYYSMDLTIAENYRRGLGRIMKQAMVMLAMENGVTAIHGRNRDRLARGMWAINLSLGSFEFQYLVDDYPDQGPHRDCIYYRCPLDWSEVDADLLNQMNLASMVNGIGLKNVAKRN